MIGPKKSMVEWKDAEGRSNWNHKKLKVAKPSERDNITPEIVKFMSSDEKGKLINEWNSDEYESSRRIKFWT